MQMTRTNPAKFTYSFLPVIPLRPLPDSPWWSRDLPSRWMKLTWKTPKNNKRWGDISVQFFVILFISRRSDNLFFNIFFYYYSILEDLIAVHFDGQNAQLLEYTFFFNFFVQSLIWWSVCHAILLFCLILDVSIIRWPRHLNQPLNNVSIRRWYYLIRNEIGKSIFLMSDGASYLSGLVDETIPFLFNLWRQQTNKMWCVQCALAVVHWLTAGFNLLTIDIYAYQRKGVPQTSLWGHSVFLLGHWARPGYCHSFGPSLSTALFCFLVSDRLWQRNEFSRWRRKKRIRLHLTTVVIIWKSLWPKKLILRSFQLSLPSPIQVRSSKMRRPKNQPVRWLEGKWSTLSSSAFSNFWILWIDMPYPVNSPKTSKCLILMSN